jgi:UTP--glucose-1-phosphate uridylyltransferase
MTRIRKAVFPVAGLGTRFLPATKAIPKELLTIVDRPVIEYVVEEAIEDHFDHQFELEHMLRERGKTAELEALQRRLPAAGEASFTRQQAPLGLGHAVWCARDIIGNEPFAVLLPDVIVQHTPGCLAQMMDAARSAGERANVIAVEEVPADRVHMYGIVGVGETKGSTFTITEMVEKPARERAPSNLSITGRYILQPEIFDVLARQQRGAGGEIQLTDAMIALAGRQPFYGFKFAGRSFDCGSKIGFLTANAAYALARPDLGAELRALLKELVFTSEPI